MIFGRRKDSVAAPASDAAQSSRNSDDTTVDAVPRLVVEPGPTPRELVRAIAGISDDMKWLDERFTKLQNRVTTELREIRREVDRFYEEPEETE
jgi:hypothetical protein